MDRIDPCYYAKSNRINLAEETRIKATSNEATEWVNENKALRTFPQYRFSASLSISNVAPAPNFISDIFYLTIAMGHYGYQRTIHSFGELAKHIDDIQRHLDYLNGDGSWMGVNPYSRLAKLKYS